MQQALAKNEIAKVFVGGNKDAIDVEAPIQHRLILVDILVRDYLHAWTDSIGYTTSAPSTLAAKAIAARMPSSVRRGCAAWI